MSDKPQRVLPAIGGRETFFWTMGADGVLRFLRCDDCRHFIHPPAPVCPSCRGRAASPAPVSGQGIVHSFTVNRQQWDRSPEPYVIAIVELAEQEGLRLTTNLVDIAVEDAQIGLPVEVVFEDHDPVFIPLFRPSRP